MKYSKTIEGRISIRMAHKQSSVLLREDFADPGGYDQVGGDRSPAGPVDPGADGPVDQFEKTHQPKDRLQ
jgi:hypothetical protein